MFYVCILYSCPFQYWNHRGLCIPHVLYIQRRFTLYCNQCFHQCRSILMFLQGSWSSLTSPLPCQKREWGTDLRWVSLGPVEVEGRLTESSMTATLEQDASLFSTLEVLFSGTHFLRICNKMCHTLYSAPMFIVKQWFIRQIAPRLMQRLPRLHRRESTLGAVKL